MRPRAIGFTLLEVMVAMAILALSLTAIAGINAAGFANSNYAKYVTVATLLARSKMIDVEEELRKDGFPDSDKVFDGDFEKEGYPGFRFVATSRKVEMDIGRLISSFLGGDEEDFDAEQLPPQMQEMLKAIRGDGNDALEAGLDRSELKQLAGGEVGSAVMESMFKQVSETLARSIREITLEILWGREGIDEDSVRFVQYLTIDGRLSMAPPPRRDEVAPGDRNSETLTPPDKDQNP
ncbi:MAG: prepilin-type N-terminal cleavage/methylation domain-containing protein [Deltaproteobacteria bacterium]|nr:prepilin-type N-terminal cleavage/methylation domain-containing protein [Deltaproteobacteria bacterium]